MRPLRALVIYTVVVFIGGALLAPWIYWLAQSLAHVLPSLAGKPFQRYLGDTMAVVAVAGLWPLLRALGVRSLQEAGFTNPLGQERRIGVGILLALLSVGIISALTIIFGAREIREGINVAGLVRKTSGIALTAAMVGLFEELLFRGGLLGGLRRLFFWPFALVASSVAYSLTHFLRDATFEGAVTWTTGLQLLPSMFGGSMGWAQAVPRFLNLTLVGVMLGLAYQRTGNLWFSIGMHAGWILWVKVYHLLTQPVWGSCKWFWGTVHVVDGWLATPVLILVSILITQSPLVGQIDPVHDQGFDGVRNSQ